MIKNYLKNIEKVCCGPAAAGQQKFKANVEPIAWVGGG